MGIFKEQAMQINLFGETQQEQTKASILEQRFLIPPFSVFDTKQGYWQDRKRLWLELGIKSELGRGDGLTFNLNSFNYDDDKKIQELKKELEHVGSASTFTMKYDEEKYGVKQAQATSIFDPVLCELCYKWYNINDGKIFDPFAGGSVRGIVASMLGYTYTGIDLSLLQIEANKQNAIEVIGEDYSNTINWINDDSMNLLNYVQPNTQDLIFTCPPYFDLEVYSDKENDLSNMSWEDFKDSYFKILSNSAKVLKDNRFFIVVIGDVRNNKTGEYIGLVNYTKDCLSKCGLKEWNEVILLNSIGTACLRASAPFNANRKLTKVHQNVLIFYKGDTSKIKDNYKEVDFNY